MSKINKDFTIKLVLKFIRANMQSIKTRVLRILILTGFKPYLNKVVGHFAQVKMAKTENSKDK